MSAVVCTSRWVCFVNGLRGTVLFLVSAALGWALVEGVPLWPVLFGLAVVGGAMVLRGTMAATLTLVACVWVVATYSIWGPL